MVLQYQLTILDKYAIIMYNAKRIRPHKRDTNFHTLLPHQYGMDLIYLAR